MNKQIRFRMHKSCHINLLVYFRLVVHTNAIIDTRAQRMVSHAVAQFAHDYGEKQNTLSQDCPWDIFVCPITSHSNLCLSHPAGFPL